MIRAIIQYLSNAVASINTGIITLARFARQIFDTGLLAIQQLVSSGSKTIITLALSLTARVTHAIDYLASIIHTNTIRIITGFSSTCSTLFTETCSIILNISKIFKSLFIDAPQQILTFIINILNKTTHTILSTCSTGFSTINTIISAVLETISSMVMKSTRSTQSLMTNIANLITSTLGTILSRTLESILGICHSVQQTTYELSSILTRIAAWAIFKILSIITYTFDGISTTCSIIKRSALYLFANILNTPKRIAHTILLIYQTLNNLLSNLFAALIEREWALVTALQRIISKNVDFILHTVRFLTQSITDAIIFIALDLPRATLNKAIDFLSSITTKLSTVFSFTRITHLLESIGLITHQTITASAGFIFHSIPQKIFASITNTVHILSSNLSKAITGIFSSAVTITKNVASTARRLSYTFAINLTDILSSFPSALWSFLSGAAPRLQTAHSMAKNALSGTAGFLFLDIPRGLWKTINHITFLVGSSTVNTCDTIKNSCAPFFTLIFISLPLSMYGKTMRSARFLKHGTHQSTRFIWQGIWGTLESAFSLTKGIFSSMVNMSARLLRTLFFDIPGNLFYSLHKHGLTVKSNAIYAFEVLSNTLQKMIVTVLFKLPQSLWNTVISTSQTLCRVLKIAFSTLTTHTKNISLASAHGLWSLGKFIFISTPRNILAGFMFIAESIGLGITHLYIKLTSIFRPALNFIFHSIPYSIFGATKYAGKKVGASLQSTHEAITPKLMIAHSVTKQAISGSAGFIFLTIPRGVFYSIKTSLNFLADTLITTYYGMKAGLAWLAKFLFVQFPTVIFHSLKAFFDLFFSGLAIALTYLHRIVRGAATIVLAILALTNKFFTLIGTGSRIVLESILGLPRKIAMAVVATVTAIQYLAKAVWNALTAIWDGLCYLAATPLLALRHCCDMLIAQTHYKYQASVTTIYAQRSNIHRYAFLGTGIYLLVVLFATYNNNYNKPVPKATLSNNNMHIHATPITVDLDVHTLRPAKDGFGCVELEGILSYAYNTGTESAKSVDDFSIKNTEQHTLKKLSSSVNHNHVTTTRYLLTAKLSPNPNTTITFPFAGSQSSFAMLNHSLSAREIHYQGTPHAFATNSSYNLGLQKILMEAGTNKTHARSESALTPEITITLEYQRWSPLMLFGLYILLFTVMLMSIASLLILAKPIRLTVSGISFCLLGIVWIGCYFSGMLTTINHLMITLLSGLALSAIIIALNASANNLSQENQTNPNYQEGQFEGQTRWVLVLLSLLAILLTMLIKL